MGDIHFNRNDILQGAATARGCLKVLPLGKSKTQKIVLGSFNGVLQSFSYKKGELLTSFKTLPTGKPIDAVELGLGQGQKDKIFSTSQQTLRGVNKKGKEFFKFKTNLTERINWFKVHELQLWVCSEFTFNHYVDCKDKNFYLCNDKINEMMAIPIVGDHAHNAVLACNDQMVRVLQGSEVYYEAAVDGAVRTIYHTGSKVAGKHREVFYSTSGGLVGQIFMDAEAVKRGWKIPAEKLAAADSIEAAVDYTKDGRPDLVIGRDDGSVEVYCVNDDGATPTKVFEKSIGEAITSIGSGYVTDSTIEDIVLSTYSGKVLSLSQATADGQSMGTGEEKIASGKAARVLMKDIENLKGLVNTARGRYSQVSEDLVAVDKGTFHVNDKFCLDPHDGSYALTIESPMPIFTIAVQSDVPVELLETEANVAIMSQSPPDPENGNFCLATYRCQETSNRIEIKMRAVEGHFGTVQAFVIPRVAPKTSQICSYRIKPLCLQHRVQKVDEKRPMNELKITGQFSLAELHAWVVFCLPDIPARPPADEVSYCFESVLMGTVLTARYKAGEGIFRSDSVTTLAILREGITKEATAKKQRIQVTFDLNDETVGHFLRLLHPKLEYQQSLSKKMQLIEALKEVRVQEEDISFLYPSYKEILDTAAQVEKEFKRQPRQLEYLHGVVKDLFIDFQKFKGSNVKHRVGQLEQVLRNYDVDALIQFITKPN